MTENLLPYITIKDEMISLPPPKARIWRRLMKFDAERKELEAENFIDAHCEIIAEVFGVTKDEVLDNLPIEDVLPLYGDILKYISALLSARLGEDKKNEVEE